MSELRWHPLLREWVATATDRQERIVSDDEQGCPLCPARPGGPRTEVPAGTRGVYVFENRFPSLRCDPPPPSVAGTALEPVQPARGANEVVVYAPEHDASLAQLPVERIEDVVRVWCERTHALLSRDDVQHVFPFENRGPAIGVTLAHPHGQIYGYPFVPPVLAREIASARAHRDAHGACLFCAVRRREREDGRRVVAEEGDWLAYVPFFARYPFETHLMPARCVRDLLALDDAEIGALARLLKRVLTGFDRLFGVPFPFIMAVHQGPKGDDPFHLHLEFYPPMRSATKLKYLAGSEAGAGMFINDTLAEAKAEQLRRAIEG